MPTQRIALLISHDVGYGREVLKGIASYAIKKQNWEMREAPPMLEVIPIVQQWKPHAIISNINDPSVVKALASFNVPVVDTTDTFEPHPFPKIDVDNLQVGIEAGRYFLGRGFRSFAYYGSQHRRFSRIREQGFRSVVEVDQHSVRAHYADFFPREPIEDAWLRYDTATLRWLRALIKPVAIFCSNDTAARKLANLCRKAGIKVPLEVALLGVDNDEAECRLSNPPISSIVTPTQKIGYNAAQMLDHWMQKKQKPANRLLPPGYVISRQSTEIHTFEDTRINNAISYIRENASRNITVPDVAKAAGVSRRLLDQCFQKNLGQSVLHTIHQAHLEIARPLLLETQFAAEVIAKRSGFSSARQLSEVLHRYHGVTLSVFRQG